VVAGLLGVGGGRVGVGDGGVRVLVQL
jgi:hypothetical protein